MFEHATSRNRVVTNDLSVTYEIEPQTTSGIYWYKVIRKAVKDYRYIDMTEKAALNAERSKVKQYTRSTRSCAGYSRTRGYDNLSSNIQIDRNECGSFDLVINVNEIDSVPSRTFPSDPSTLFSPENGRDYDEYESGLSVARNESYGEWAQPPEGRWKLCMCLDVYASDLVFSGMRFWLKAPGGEFIDITDNATISVDETNRICSCLYYEYFTSGWEGDFEMKATLHGYESDVVGVEEWR